MMKNKFRPTIGSYLDSLMMLFGIVIAAYLYVEDIISLLLFTICLVGLLCLTVSGLYKTWRHSLCIDAEAIQGHVDGVDFKIYWQDVIAIKFIEEPAKQPNFLLVGTRVGHNIISLQNFNDKQVWQAVQHYAPPPSLEEEAYKRLPDYHRWKDHHGNLINTHIPTLSVKIYTFYRIIFWIGLFLCLTIIILVLPDKDLGSLFCISGFAMLCILPLALSPSSIEADMDSISKKTWLGQYKIRWDEITLMEIGQRFGNLIFSSESKRLVIPGLSSWEGPDVQEMCDYLSIQIAERDIETKATSWAELKWSKNVKVK